MGHALMEHRQGLPVDVQISEVSGFAEREAALTMPQAPGGAQRQNGGRGQVV
jgi:hypothetical protein